MELISLNILTWFSSIWIFRRRIKRLIIWNSEIIPCVRSSMNSSTHVKKHIPNIATTIWLSLSSHENIILHIIQRKFIWRLTTTTLPAVACTTVNNIVNTSHQIRTFRVWHKIIIVFVFAFRRIPTGGDNPSLISIHVIIVTCCCTTTLQITRSSKAFCTSTITITARSELSTRAKTI